MTLSQFPSRERCVHNMAVVPVVTDEEFLHQMSKDHVFDPESTLVQDLKDTLRAYKGRGVGLAAPQIGVLERVIAVLDDAGKICIFRNPEIVGRSPQTYFAVEGCLSLQGGYRVKRHQRVKVAWIDDNGQKQEKVFKDRMAQKLQHEIDHLHGILIKKEV